MIAIDEKTYYDVMKLLRDGTDTHRAIKLMKTAMMESLKRQLEPKSALLRKQAG
jgi:hypothetical protein